MSLDRWWSVLVGPVSTSSCQDVRLDHHVITDREVVDALTHGRHHAGHLVAEGDGRPRG